jgi:uncharacterized protein (DUF58 family)
MLTQLTKKIRKLDIYTNKNVNEVFAGNYKSSFKGQGLEMHDIRKYEEGDDIRHIDWITTAKQGKPFIKQYTETRELTTYVIVDISASMNFGTAGIKKKEQAIETTATLLFSALKNNDKTGAIIFSDKINSYIPAKKGKTHILRILRDLIYHYENNKYQPSNQEKAIQFFNNTVKKHSIAFFISDELTDIQDKHLTLASRKNDFIFLQISDPLEKGFLPQDTLRIEDPETGKTTIINLADKNTQKQFLQIRTEKQRKTEKKLTKNNIDHLDISTDKDIFKTLLKFFKVRQRKQ